MDICISSGHGSRLAGASGVLVEVPEARKVTDRVAALLRSAGHIVHVFHDNTSTSVSANIGAIVRYHNARKRDRDVSVHFNAFSPTSKPMGTEVCYLSQATLAGNISKAMATAGGFINRGGKKRTNLGFLNSCAKPAVLLEVCFVDSSADAALYRKNFEAICRAAAETIGGKKIPGEPPVVEPPIEPPPPPPEEVGPTGDHVVDIAIVVKGNPTVIINGDKINDGLANSKLELTLAHHGDIMVTVDGEDFQIEPPTKPPSEPRPTLRNGSRGELVRDLQRAIGVTPDGIFGNNTEAAVKSFQRENGLSADGIVGPLTWAKLEQVYDLPPYVAPTVQWFEDIKASVFGGAKDPNNSAYSPFNFINDTERSVALPWKFTGARPQVLVRNRANGREVTCQIRDVGPWLIDDDYFYKGKRPLAETCFKNKTPIPRGKHKGKIGNGAGIDLTPGSAKAIGLSGMGQVDWCFV